MTDFKALLTSRATQLVARYAGMILIAKLGFDAAGAQATAADLAAGLVGAALTALDHLAHCAAAKRIAEKAGLE